MFIFSFFSFIYQIETIFTWLLYARERQGKKKTRRVWLERVKKHEGEMDGKEKEDHERKNVGKGKKNMQKIRKEKRKKYGNVRRGKNNGSKECSTLESEEEK